MESIRGRRVLLLLALAVQLLAENDVADAPSTALDEHLLNESLPTLTSILVDEQNNTIELNRNSTTKERLFDDYDLNFVDGSCDSYQRSLQLRSMHTNDTPMIWYSPSGILISDLVRLTRFCHFPSFQDLGNLDSNDIESNTINHRQNDNLDSKIESQGKVADDLHTDILSRSQDSENIVISPSHAFDITLDGVNSKLIHESAAKRVEVDYASKSAGALILEQSHNFQGTSNLLVKDNDKYAIVPCNEPIKYVVVGLSEDILVKSVMISNYERYSSHTKDFNISGRSTTMGEWNDLGTYTAEPLNSKQTFHLRSPMWARYLKIQFLTHYGSEDYCTVSQLSVHGSTMLQGFHEQWHDDDVDRNISSRGAVIDGIVEQANTNSNKLVSVKSERPRISTESAHELSEPTKDKATINDINIAETSETDTCSLIELYTRSLDFCPRNEFSKNESNKLLLSSLMVRQSNDFIVGQRIAMSQVDVLPITLVAPNKKVHSKGTTITSEGTNTNLELDEMDDGNPVVERIKELLRTTADAVDDLTNSRQKSSSANGIDHAHIIPVVTVSNSETLAAVSTPGDRLYSRENEKETTGSHDKPLLNADRGNSNLLTDSRHREKLSKSALDMNKSKFAAALSNFPSAQCLSDLDFPTFKGDLLTTRKTVQGMTGNGTPGNSMEPIFKKLADEIKILQANMLAHDQFTAKAISCYQTVLLDLVLEMQVTKDQYDQRIVAIENAMKAGNWWRPVLNEMPFVDIQSIWRDTVVPCFTYLASFLRVVFANVVMYMDFIIYDKDSALATSIRWLFGLVQVAILLYKMGVRIVFRAPSEHTCLLISSSIDDSASMSSTDSMDTKPMKEKQKGSLASRSKVRNQRRRRSHDIQTKT